MLLTRLRNSLKFRRNVAPVAATRPFPKDDAPTAELVSAPAIERAPELPAISARMLRCNGQRKRALRYEPEFYAALRR